MGDPHNTDSAKTDPRLYFLAIFLICGLAAVLYSNTLQSPFIFDDLPNITENSHIRLTEIDPEQIADAAFGSPNKSRPLSNVTFALNYYLGGYRVAGYHVFNILLHMANGVLVFFFSRILFRKFDKSEPPETGRENLAVSFLGSAFCALMFVAHPIQVLSVTYIVQRMNSLAVLFYLLALVLYIHYREAKSRKYRPAMIAGCIVSWLLALGSKEIAATLPLIIIVYEWTFHRRETGLRLLEKKGLLIGLIALFLLCGFFFLGSHPVERILGLYGARDFTLTERVLTQSRVIVFYISLLFFPLPSRLNLLHGFEISESLFSPITTLGALLLIILLLLAAVYMNHRQKIASFCVLWFFINLAIESSIIGLEMIFEHRLYLPMVGFSLVVVFTIFRVLGQKILVASVIVSVFVIMLSLSTYQRNGEWADAEIIWTDVLSKNPRSYRAHLNLGAVLKEKGRVQEAMDHYSAALALKPEYAKALYNMGNALDYLSRPQEAIRYYKRALQLDPDYVQAHFNLANTLAGQGDIALSLFHYKEALRLNPLHIKAENNLGVALAKSGRLEEAIEHFSKALKINSSFAGARKNLNKAREKLKGANR